MGRIFTGVNGGFSGKVGSVIGSSWRAVNYMRGLARPSDKAPSESQLAQRRRFSVAVRFLSQIKDLLNDSYGRLNTSKATGYNLAVQETLLHAVTGTFPDFKIDYPKVLLSKGSLYTTPKLSVTSENGAGKVKFAWESVPNRYNSFSSDIVTIVVYNETKNLFVVDQSATRQDEQIELDLGLSFSTDTVHCYVYFESIEKGRVSQSIYGGKVEVF